MPDHCVALLPVARSTAISYWALDPSNAVEGAEGLSQVLLRLALQVRMFRLPSLSDSISHSISHSNS